MEGEDFDENAFFAAIAQSRSRALLIGRRALIALGLPVMTADYDFWLHQEDIALFNDALEPFGFLPTRAPDEARTVGRYALEDGEHVDVMVAPNVALRGGDRIRFDEVWAARTFVDISGHQVAIPNLDHLIATKRIGARAKDIEDIRFLEALKRRGPS